jgi:hypothetical protein
MRVFLSRSAIAIAAVLLAGVVPAAAQTGLVAAYAFDEATGTTVTDSSGLGNTGSISGATRVAAGKFGGALSFDGTSNWVTVPHSASLSLTNGMTVEAWIQTSSPTNWRCVAMKERSGGLSYALYAGDISGRAAGYIRRTSDIDATASTVLPVNVWVHVATTYDGATLRTYVNGAQVASRAVTGNIVTSTSPLRIGGDSIWGEYFTGLIDEVRIYNRALTAAQLQADMTTPIGTAVPPVTYSIKGVISPASLAAGATVSASGPVTGTATVDGAGTFAITGLSNGSYSVAAAKAGVVFSPVSQTINVNGSDVSGVSFTATTTTTGGVRLVQSAVNGSESSIATISASFPSPNTAGNALIVTGTAARPAGTLTISDSLGNIYTPAMGPLNDPVQDVDVYIWYVANSKGGTNTVTLTPTGARALEIHVSEWSGLSSTAPLDQTAWNIGTGSTASSDPITPRANGELVFAYTFIGNNATAGAGFTPITLVNGDLDEYLVQQNAVPVTATFTQSSGPWDIAVVTMRPATAADTTVPTVAITSPSSSPVNGLISLSATASDDFGVSSVQFQIDGANVGAPVPAAPYTISWNSASVADGSHTITAIATDTSGNQGSATIAVTVGNAAVPSVVGQWAAPFDVGLVAVNTVMLHTGKVLMFSGSFQVSYPARVWDPATGTLTTLADPPYNIFCAGQAQLPDGRILVAGGYDSASLGASGATIFDPVTMSWATLPKMAYRRWYPTVTGLPDGRMLVTSGGQACLSCLADIPEIFNPATNTFSKLTSASLPIWYYPFMFVLPDGRVLSAGSNEQPYETRTLDLTSGAWSMVDPVVRDGHSAVMYRPGKILKTGTAADSGTTGNAANTAFVLDMTQPSPAWRAVANMHYPRAFQNSTILPDGNVLVTGGGTALDGYDVSNGVLTPELWDPNTETWQTLSPAALARLYHSTALLLPDGRVLMAGSGDDGPAVNQTRAEIYSPPYLFKGARPSITGAPDLIQYAAAFSVQTPDAASIKSVVLIRPGSPTHAFDEDQRYLELSFTATGGGLSVQAPANANLAPPGYYMLFLVNSTGVPSVAAFVHFPAPTVDAQAPTAPGNLTAAAGVGATSLAWAAATDNVGVTIYNVYRSTLSGFAPSTSNRVGQVAGTSYVDSNLPSGTYFYLVTAQDAAGNVGAPSNEASATIAGDSVAPTVAVTSPSDGSTVSGTVTITAAASDNVAVAGVQFMLDGVALGAERTSAPYSVTWNTTASTNTAHTIAATARDAAGNKTTATITVTVSNTTQVPTGLVAAYGFNEGSGSVVNDTSGFNNNGTIKAATWSASGHTGSALSFDGTSAWVAIPTAAQINLTSGMTLEAWVMPTAGTGWRSVILKEGTNALSYALYSANNASRPGGWVHSGSSDVSILGTAAVTLNTWTHLAVTFDGSALRFYTNGVLVRTVTGVSSISTTTGGLKLGGNSVWGEYFKGLIDDVRIYNRALSAAEIGSDMTTGIR